MGVSRRNAWNGVVQVRDEGGGLRGRGMERRVRLEENTEWLVGEEVGGGRGSYFAFFCVSSWSPPPPAARCYPVALLSLEAWTNARGFKCTCLLHIPFIKTHMPSVERVGTRAEVLESEIGPHARDWDRERREIENDERRTERKWKRMRCA